MPLAGKKDRQDESNLPSNDDPSSGFIRFKVENVSDLPPKGVYSPVVKVHRLPWKLLVKKEADTSFLEVYLHNWESESDMWSVDASIEFSLINVSGGENIIKGFSKDNKIIVEARFTLSNIVGIRTISPIDYSDPNVPSHDITFLIDGEKIHANKGILAVHSPVFSAMFYGEFAEKNNKEVELKDVDRKAFIDMLNLIYPSYEKISVSNCESILKLADQFQIDVIIDQVEKFLIYSTEFIAVKKLHLSDQYRLVQLQDHCLGDIESVDDVLDLKETDGFKELADNVKALLLEKTYKQTFNHEYASWGYLEFYKWEDLLNEEKGFIKDNKIIIEVRFTLSNFIGIRTVSPIDYSDPNVSSHDITFLIDGKKIHANKGILCVHSPVFSAMFYGEFTEKNKKEIELKDVDSKAFIGMLNLLYPSYEKISDSNCESILKIADRFQIDVIIDQAEKFLIDSIDFNAVKKLLLSDQYRLANLQDHCLGNVKSVKDVSDLKKTDGYKELSDKVKALLLEKVLNSSQAT
eukprot:PDM67024.1 BTB domain-containing protein [Pristionchus pacificus]